MAMCKATMDPNMMNTQMGQASFFYYTPDPNPETRQHGHFSQHPGFQQQQMQSSQHMYPMVPTLPSTPIYSRPNSSCSQQTVPAKVYTTVLSNVTPQRPNNIMTSHPGKLMVETDFCENDSYYYPATPPLSTSGSSMGSPAHMQDVLSTPLNPMFSGLDGCEMIKADEEAVSQSLENLDWSHYGSPPVTPVYLQHLQVPQPGKTLSLSANLSSDNLSAATTITSPTFNPSDITIPDSTASDSFSSSSSSSSSSSYPPSLSSSISCTSLSSSPSPTCEQDLDFCDPRNLTVGGISNSILTPEFASSSPSPVAREEFRSETTAKETTIPVTFDLSSVVQRHHLPTFDDISDLESEDDFVNRLVNLGEQSSSSEVKRSRSGTCSTTLSLGHDSFLSEVGFDYEDSTSCCATGLSSQDTFCDEDTHQDKKVKMSKMESYRSSPAMHYATDSTVSQDQQQQQQQQQQEETTAQNEANNANQNRASTSDNSDLPQTPIPAPANRRGRKQSLTEDPSKTFVCDICNRRFRRQEHLKRHYRSLHTHDKPFGCNECGKSFSRSDNLAQHARTHGSGAIVMNLLDGSEEGGLDMIVPGESEYHNYGKVLFQVAAEVSGSSSESSDDSQSESGGKKKRKRSE